MLKRLRGRGYGLGCDSIFGMSRNRMMRPRRAGFEDGGSFGSGFAGQGLENFRRLGFLGV